MTQDRRITDKHPARPLDWENTEPLAGQVWNAPAGQQEEGGAVLTDQDIFQAWQGMPGGADGWLKTFGYIQFARAIEAELQRRCRAQHTNNEVSRDEVLEEAAKVCCDAYKERGGTAFLYAAQEIRALKGTATPAPAPAGGDTWISVDERLPEASQLVMVYSPPTQYDHPGGINIGFDCIDPNDDDHASWLGHNEHYEHFCCVAKPEGSIGPSEKAPYTHWMPLPQAPTPPVSSGVAGEVKS